MPFVKPKPALTAEAKPSSLAAQRNAPPELSEQQIREEIPLNWKYDQTLWSYVTKYLMKASGVGFVTPPYVAYWERVWGATPIEELPTYKQIYCTVPYVKTAIDVTVNLTVGNSFELKGSTDEVREWLEDWIDEHNLLDVLRVIETDKKVFGNAYAEICREDEEKGGYVDPEEWWLKPLDPVFMRVRRDSYGNIFGYIQLLTMPPVIFTAQDIVHFRTGTKSWWYEQAYGTSLLRPLLLIEGYIDDFQNDMALIMKAYTKPMLDVTCGTPERPFGDAMIGAVQNAFAQRGPVTDVFHRGDISVKVIGSMTSNIRVQWWLDYLNQQRASVLGVPGIFMAKPEGTNRATADIVMQEYVTRVKMAQEELSDTLETGLFKQLIEAKFGEGIELPEISWRPVWEPTTDVKAKYVGDLYTRGILAQNEARVSLGFPELEGNETLMAAPLANKQKQEEEQPSTSAGTAS